MKLLLLFLIIYGQSMNFEKFENFLGRDITYVDNMLLGEGFECENIIGLRIYTSFRSKRFYNTPYNMISIITDENEIVSNVNVHFLRIIDNNFYDSFILDYGIPDKIQVVDKPKQIGGWTKSDGKEKIEHKVRRVILKTREGEFEENPLFMIWKKKDYEIKTLTKENQNRSEIIFSIPNR